MEEIFDSIIKEISNYGQQMFGERVDCSYITPPDHVTYEA